MRKVRKGFTLIELIIVIIIVGILATIAVPQYLKATERAKGGKAKSAMALIAQGEKFYRAEIDTYVITGVDANNATLGSYIELAAVDADPDWNYEVGGVSASAFLITATRQAGAGSGGTLTLDQNGVWSGTGYGITGIWTPSI